MKTTLNLKGATLVAGVPANIRTNASGRLSVGEKYRVIGFANVAKSDNIPAWTGVALEKLSTKGQIIVGVNTMLGTSIVLVAKDKYEVRRVEGHPFTSASEFASKPDADNDTVFTVSDLHPMEVNEFIKLKTDEFEDKHLSTKMKDFYQMKIEVAE